MARLVMVEELMSAARELDQMAEQLVKKSRRLVEQVAECQEGEMKKLLKIYLSLMMKIVIQNQYISRGKLIQAKVMLYQREM